MSVLCREIRERGQWRRRHDQAIKSWNPLVGLAECVIMVLCFRYLMGHCEPMRHLFEIVLIQLRGCGLI